MEKWARNLSKSTALTFGIVSLVTILGLTLFVYNTVTGLIPLILFCAFLGGGIGFAALMLSKGITGLTPQERKEAGKK